MMDVMKSDVAAEPLKNFRELVERATFEGRSKEIPLHVTRPVDSLILVLDIEKP